MDLLRIVNSTNDILMKGNEAMDEQLKQNLKNGKTWVRGLYMAMYVVFLFMARIVVAATVLFQFASAVFTGKANPRLVTFATGLGEFIYQSISYLTYTSEEKPFPFKDWPGHAEKKAAKRKSLTKDKAVDAVEVKSHVTNVHASEPTTPASP